MAIFAEVVKQGSFNKAASILGLSASVVSYQIDKLEQKLGKKLLYRSTRSLSLSSEGKEFHLYVVNMLAYAEQGITLMQEGQQILSGSLHVTLPNALIHSRVCVKIAEFSQLHPKLNLQLTFNDHHENLIAKGIDVAIRAGNLKDSALNCRRIGEINRKLVCSPSFLKGKPTPTDIDSLSLLNWIRLHSLPASRELISPEGVTVICHYQSNITVNNVTAMTELCLNGAGVATLPAESAQQKIEQGLLIELLPTWKVANIPLYAVTPNELSKENNVYKLVSYISALN